MAEVRVVRTVRSRAELAYRNVIVEQQASGLVVRGELEREGAVPRGVQVRAPCPGQNPTPGKLKGKQHQRRRDHRQHRWASSSRKHQRRGPTSARGPLIVNGVSGPLTVGNVGDRVQLTNISGDLTVGRTVGHLELTDVSGNVTATIERLDDRGVLVRGVSGAIELRFAGALNADVVASNVDGDLLLDLPDVSMQSTPVRTVLRARVGTGGLPISITEVSGKVRLIRAG